MNAPLDDDGGLSISAGEYVIGTLDAQERVAFASLLRKDANARAAVANWERRLWPLVDEIDVVAPSPEVWPRIEQGLQATGGRPLPFRVIQGGSSTLAPPILRSRDRWRTAALLSGAVAASLIVFVAARERTLWQADDANSTFVAAVNRGGDKPALIVRVDLKSGRVLVHPVAAEAPAGHSLELWYINEGKAPRSMGLVKAEPATLEIPQGARADARATFAVSVEPPGGSTTGGPTGPVVYSGQLVKE